MGDRGNIIVKDGDSTVYLYTHWRGSEIPSFVRKSLARARDRWTDGQYFARVLFQDLISGDTGISGFGISSTRGDGGTDVTVDIDKQQVDGVAFEEYLTRKEADEE